jgi:hypothetical protein
MIDRPSLRIGKEITLAHIGDIGRIIVFREQVVEGLVAAWPDVFRDRLVPFFRIGKHRIDIEDDTPKGEQAMANHITNAEAGTCLAGRANGAASLARKELCAFHASQYGPLPPQNKHVARGCPRYARILCPRRSWQVPRLGLTGALPVASRPDQAALQ